MIIRYFKCPVCGKTTPLENLEFPEDDDGLFTIQERKAAGRGGFPAIGEYDVLESDEDDDEVLLSLFAKRILELYNNLVEQGYLLEEDDEE